MLAFEDRYTRQRQLPEVGFAGQEKIAQLRTQIGVAEGCLVALSYLHRAGAASVNLSPGKPAVDFPHSEFFRHAGPREVGAGAHLALRLILDQLQLAPTPSEPL